VNLPLATSVCALLVGFMGCSSPDDWASSGMETEAAVFRSKPVELSQLTIAETRYPQMPPVDADTPWELSVEEAILLALEGNRDLHFQRLEPVVAGAFEAIERGAYDLELFGEIQYGEQNVLEVYNSTSTQSNVEGENSRAELGLRQILPTGTTLEATVTQDFADSSRTSEKYETRVGITVTQALLRGFGPSVNLARVWQAKRETLATQYELRGFTEQLVATIESSYWHYVLAREEITIFERSLELAQRHWDEIKQQIEVGVLSRTDGAAVQAEVALREQALIDAKSEMTTAHLQVASLIFGTLPGGFDRKLIANSPIESVPDDLGALADRVKLARQVRPELNEARLRLEQRRLETVVTRNGLLPRLDFFATLGRSGFASNYSKSIDALDSSSYDFSTGLSLNYSLGSRRAEGRDLVARAEQRQAEIAIANLEFQIELEVRLAANEVQQIYASKVSRELREEAARAEKERFDVGSSTGLQVAQVQRDLLESRIAEVEAMVDYRLALIQLYLAEGSLLENRGISLNLSGER